MYIDLALGEQCDPPSRDPSHSYCRNDCTVDCAGGYVWPKNNHCYQLLPVPQSASAYSAGPDSATGHCAQSISGGHPVTFASEEEYQAVLGYYADAGGGGAPFWVGLQVTQSFTDNGHYTSAVDHDLEPGWRPACPGCYAHTPDPSLPLQGDQGGCVLAMPNAHPTAWQAAKCYGGGPQRVLCEREPSTTAASSQAIPCDAGVCINLVYTYPRKSYVYMDIELPEEEAGQSCRDIGGRLVVLESRDEREQLWYQLYHQGATSFPNQFWVGLARARPADADAGAEAGEAGTSVRSGPWTWENDAGADAYAPEWAYSQPLGTGIAAATTRAFLSIQPNASYSSLASNAILDPTNDPPIYAYVCELPGPDAGM